MRTEISYGVLAFLLMIAIVSAPPDLPKIVRESGWGLDATGRQYEYSKLTTRWHWSRGRMFLVYFCWLSMIGAECMVLVTAVKRDRRLNHGE